MKFLALILVMSSSAFAVEVKNCPEVINLSYSDLQLTKTADQLIADEGGEDAFEFQKLWAVREAFKNLSKVQVISRTFTLTKKQNGRCKYSEGFGEEKAEIYTTNGKDLLLIQTNIARLGILARVYAKLTKVEKTSLEFQANPGLALAIPRSAYDDYSVGGPLVFVGNVKKLTLKVR